MGSDLAHSGTPCCVGRRVGRGPWHFLSKLAREVSRLTGWRDKVFARRYQAIPISEEEVAQVSRLIYILNHGCKEDLVERPQDWPGVHCVDALLSIPRRVFRPLSASVSPFLLPST